MRILRVTKEAAAGKAVNAVAASVRLSTLHYYRYPRRGLHRIFARCCGLLARLLSTFSTRKRLERFPDRMEAVAVV
jgi:hypothetical protein